MRRARATVGLLALAAACAATSRTPRDSAIAPAFATAPVAHDPDDPAIWIDRTDPSRSLILATDKAAVQGGLYVFALDGRVRQVIGPLDRPNNVDVTCDVALGGRRVDIAVLTERLRHRLRVYGIPADGSALIDLAPAGIPVLEGEQGEASQPMGIALYRRPSDGATFAIVTPKTGRTERYLWQYRLESDGTGGVRGTLARRFGAFSGDANTGGEIEAVVADSALGFVYYSDEDTGIRKYAADPDAPHASRELALFGTEGYRGDREGLAIYPTGATTGYLVSSDQVEGGTRIMIYPREGEPGMPNRHPRLAIVPTVSDATDGLEVTATPLPGFPDGMLVMMNSGPRNFLVYDWRTLRARLHR